MVFTLGRIRCAYFYLQVRMGSNPTLRATLYLRVIESAVDAVSDVSSNWGTAAGKAKQQEIE